MSSLRDAACAGMVEVFEGRTAQDRAQAVEVCASCPLGARRECRELADRLHAQGEAISGIWDSTLYGEFGYKPRRLSVPLADVTVHGSGVGRKAKCRCEPCLDWERAKSSARRKGAA